MFFDQRLYFFPIQPGQTTGQTRQSQAGDFFFFNKITKRMQRMIHLVKRSQSRFAAMAVSGIMGKQINNLTTIGTFPCQQAAGLGMLYFAKMAEVLVHGGHALAQLQGQAMQKIIVGRDTLRDGFRTAEQDVSAQFVNHVWPIRFICAYADSQRCADAMRST